MNSIVNGNIYCINSVHGFFEILSLCQKCRIMVNVLNEAFRKYVCATQIGMFKHIQLSEEFLSELNASVVLTLLLYTKNVQCTVQEPTTVIYEQN